ncbi:Aste57867_15943 [Aphanomyces stellatus]|uniref:Aste57867_15943 protein n=1 Tax=Aphanomyces stellatus TaxID=120398 RepID=A0A485L4A6_9STRA|nr:hypothetical protein As57867_015887 [Aphanomyces stellatus]VFT92729.1 Aste57867_15943 [Aphanomyces stellatus]
MTTPALPVTMSLGVDNNGIKTGDWKTDLFGCFDTLVPNALMSIFLPCVTLSQIVVRLGFFQYVPSLIVTFAISVFFLIAGIVQGQWLNVIVLIISCFIALALCYLRVKVRSLFFIPGSLCEDCMVSFFCSCCSIAQIASHVESYTAGACSFEAKATLPGYKL